MEGVHPTGTAPPAPPGGPERSGAPPFVGREVELRLLESALKGAADGRGRLVLIAGEPGAGKSRLLDEVARRSTGLGALVHWGRCWEAGGAPAYWPWVQSLRALLRSVDDDDLRAFHARAGPDVARLLPELRERFPDLPATPSVDPETARFRLFEGVAELLGHAARRCPRVVAIDDLHAADVPSVVLLRFLASQVTGDAVLIVAAYRDTELDPDHPLAGPLAGVLRDPAVDHLHLGGLTESDVARFVELVTSRPTPPAVPGAIHRLTRGNPLFLGEAVRLLAAEGRLDDRGVATIRHLPVPAGMRETILRRLGHLSPECRRVLGPTAVLGREFSLEALQRLSGLTTRDVLTLLDEAAAARVVAGQPEGIGRLRFAHALIRDALYDELPLPVRRELHGRAGEVLETIYGGDLEPHLAELAHHFCEAAPDGDVDRAVRYARAAAEGALRQVAYEEAARLYGMALAALDLRRGQDGALRGELLVAMGDAEARGGSTSRARETFLHAAELAGRLGLPDLLARAALGYGGRFVWARASGDPHITGLLRGALDALGEEDGALRVRLLARLSGVLRDDRAREPRWSLSRQAVDMARRLGDPATLGYALEARFAAIWEPATLAERIEIADELARLAEAARDEERAIQAHGYRVHALVEQGYMAEAAGELAAEGRLAGRVRQPAWLWLQAVGSAAVALFQGRFEEAEGMIGAALRLGERAQAADARVSFILQTYALRREQGRVDEVAGAVRRAVDEYPWYPMFHCVLTDLHVQRDDREAARSGFDRLMRDDLAVLPVDSQWLFAVSLLADAAAYLDDARAAETLYDMLLPFGDLNAYGVPEVVWGSMWRPLGILARVTGRLEEAERHLDRALDANGRMGGRPWVARTQHDLARMLRLRGGDGDHDRAAGLLEEALASARALGMAELERRVSALADETGPPREARQRTDRVDEAVFMREGDFWSIAFSGRTARLRDAKGLRYLHRLLEHPGREIHVADLAIEGGAASGATPAAEAGLTPDAGHAGDVLDPQARAAYQRRLQELREDVDEADRWNDPERAAQARAELEFISTELAGAYGLGGRPRRAGDTTERIRKAVTNRIRDSIGRLGRAHPELGRHLSNALTTGTFCSYAPDRPIRWRL
jgi:tetratricopeptide (TPR) repeat protein